MVDGTVKSVYTADGWFRDEVALVVAAVVLGALGLVVSGFVRAGGSGARALSEHGAA